MALVAFCANRKAQLSAECKVRIMATYDKISQRKTS